MGLHTLSPKGCQSERSQTMKSIKKKEDKYKIAYDKHTFVSLNTHIWEIFFPPASAWRSYRVQIGWSITASLSWWPPRDFLLTSVMSVKTHASTPRWGHNEATWPQANVVTRTFMLAATVIRSYSCLLTFTGRSGLRFSHQVSLMCSHLESNASDNR